MASLLPVASNYDLNHNDEESCGLIMQTEVCRGELMDVDDCCFNGLEAGMGLAATYVQHMLINKQKTLISCAKHVPLQKKIWINGWGVRA